MGSHYFLVHPCMCSFSAFELLKQSTLSLAATTKLRGCHEGTYCITFREVLKHIWLGKTLISLDNSNVLMDSKALLTGVSKPSLDVVFLLSYVS